MGHLGLYADYRIINCSKHGNCNYDGKWRLICSSWHWVFRNSQTNKGLMKHFYQIDANSVISQVKHSLDATIGKSYIWNNNCKFHKWAKSSFLVSHYDIISFHFRVFCSELAVVIKWQQKQQILKRKFILFRFVQTNPTFSSEKQFCQVSCDFLYFPKSCGKDLKWLHQGFGQRKLSRNPKDPNHEILCVYHL